MIVHRLDKLSSIHQLESRAAIKCDVMEECVMIWEKGAQYKGNQQLPSNAYQVSPFLKKQLQRHKQNFK